MLPTRPRRPAFARRCAILLGVLAVAGGCAAKRQPTAAESIAEGNDYFDTGAYELAIESYKALLDQHPFSEHATEAEIKIAQAYYSMARYPEAVVAFSDFERMHPTSPEVPLVTYYVGMSYLRQMRPSDRDQTAAENASGYFRAVIDRYPGSPWAARAALRRRECEESIAGHELYVARFYLRHKDFPAAEARFGRILRLYPATDAAAAALLTFGDGYATRGLGSEADLAFRSLIHHHPDSESATVARARLSAGGGDSSSLPMSADGTDPLALLLARRFASLEPALPPASAPTWPANEPETSANTAESPPATY